VSGTRPEWSGAARVPVPLVWAGLVVVLTVALTPAGSLAHPLGNFSISQYTAIRIETGAVELRYLIDLAEIPTFQEIQETGMVAETGHPSLSEYVARKVERLTKDLLLEVDGHRLSLRTESSEVIFPPGAGGLPTLKLGVLYRATLPDPGANDVRQLHYRDGNFPNRAGWKEIIAVGDRGVTLTNSSVPGTDRSRELADYPTDLLNSPPQDLEARIVFTQSPSLASAPATTGAEPTGGETPPALQGNRQGTPRSAFTELVSTKHLSVGVVLIALAVAAALGAFHALEPGHGKTVVAAYLVGSRGTVQHAVLLGLIVTASHTAGVYLLGGVTLYASRYVVPERLYPWLGVASGLAIAVLGFTLFLRRFAQAAAGHAHGHSPEHGHGHGHHHHHGADHGHGPGIHSHEVDHDHGEGAHHHSPAPSGAIALPGLVALGVSGGIIPCPAAVVVLLSAVALNRVGFGLLLIVAFSVGLAAVLIAIGILMVYAGRVMARFHGDGPLIQRWLPLASSVVITIFGVAITLQALTTAGILQIRF
jgi:nickel/cobalt exporter